MFTSSLVWRRAVYGLCMYLADPRSCRVVMYFVKKTIRASSVQIRNIHTRGQYSGFFSARVLCRWMFRERIHKGNPRLNLHLLMDLYSKPFYLCYLIFQAKQNLIPRSWWGHGGWESLRNLPLSTWLARSRPGTLICFFWFTSQVLSGRLDAYKARL